MNNHYPYVHPKRSPKKPMYKPTFYRNFGFLIPSSPAILAALAFTDSYASLLVSLLFFSRLAFLFQLRNILYLVEDRPRTIPIPTAWQTQAQIIPMALWRHARLLHSQLRGVSAGQPLHSAVTLQNEALLTPSSNLDA